MRELLPLTALLVAFCLQAEAAGVATERRYGFYQPQVKHVIIYEGKLAEGHYACNHMASVEWFDEPKCSMDHDGVSLDKPGTTGRLDLALYSSLTLVNGRPVLWYPDRKFFLPERVIKW